MKDWFLEMVEKDGCDVLHIEKWETPATNYSLEKIGKAEIRRKNYPKKGIYVMEGVDGHDFFYAENPIPVTRLAIKNKTWMVDDPLHWRGMEMLAENSKGKVLVGGLGLGLVLHALNKNPNVKEITVVEMDEDVVNLMKDKIPKNIKIVKENIYDFIRKDFEENLHKMGAGQMDLKNTYDTVILDMWVGESHEGMVGEMMSSFQMFQLANPQAKIFIWGTRNPAINPAVTKQKLCRAAEMLHKTI